MEKTVETVSIFNYLIWKQSKKLQAIILDSKAEVKERQNEIML